MNVLAKKLLIKQNSHWLLYNAPNNYLDNLYPLPDNVKILYHTDDSVNGVQLFVTNSLELSVDLKIIIPILKDDTIFWIIYPKKTSGMQTDLAMMGSWDELSVYGLRPVASAAVDDTWTALRFRPIEQVKQSEGRNDNVRNNNYSAYIDVDNKIITLPSFIKNALEQQPAALAWFQQLAYSHKKEYLLWILTAKQEKTREDRLIKMIEMLGSSKKNPYDK